MIIQFSQLKTLISLQMLQLVLKWSVHFPLSFWLKISKNILFCAIRSGSHKRVSFVYCLSTFATVRKVYSLIFFFFFFMPVWTNFTTWTKSCHVEPFVRALNQRRSHGIERHSSLPKKICYYSSLQTYLSRVFTGVFFSR